MPEPVCERPFDRLREIARDRGKNVTVEFEPPSVFRITSPILGSDVAVAGSLDQAAEQALAAVRPAREEQPYV